LFGFMGYLGGKGKSVTNAGLTRYMRICLNIWLTSTQWSWTAYTISQYRSLFDLLVQIIS